VQRRLNNSIYSSRQEEIGNVIHASFPMLVISVIVTTDQRETAVMPTVRPNLDNEVSLHITPIPTCSLYLSN